MLVWDMLKPHVCMAFSLVLITKTRAFFNICFFFFANAHLSSPLLSCVFNLRQSDTTKHYILQRTLTLVFGDNMRHWLKGLGMDTD